MTDLSPEILHLVVCPQCKGDLRYTREKFLFCVKCRLCFPVENGVPRLSLDAAVSLGQDGKVAAPREAALFTIEEGPECGTHFRLDRGSCRVLGRQLEDSAQTQVFNIDFNMSLDEHTKDLIANYVSKTTGKKKQQVKFKKSSELGSFKRLSDLILSDPGVSRLHAMIFYDDAGVGIIDLVSRNGTFINGGEVEAALLKSGDLIRMGATQIRLTLK